MSKYTIEKGIYKKDGKPVFALGVSYYASYHERKVPVPPEADRFGEAKRDIKGMSDFGFNIVRCAALGDVKYDEERRVVTDTPLLDHIAKRCEKSDIGLMLRLQGYSMNLSGYGDTLMVNHKGEDMDKTIWYDFVRDCLFHEGLNEDNDAGTRALALHFAPMNSVVGWQTYNEPHYPTSGMFDYHPKTIAAYRKWLVENGYKTIGEAENFDPPRARPMPSEDATEWIRWRTFSNNALTDFLCHSSDVAKGASGLETMTCITTGSTQTFAAVRGEDYFRIAEGMDALGITQYYQVRKPEVYIAALNLSFAESAAALAGKPLWIVEYDAKTNTPPHYFAKNSYLALGTCLRGLLYYQWRGDHVYPNSPEGNGFGIINYDGTKTENYENAKRIVSYINSRSDLLMSTQKHRSGVGILRSMSGLLRSDAKCNPCDTGYGDSNTWLDAELSFFTDCAKMGIIPDFTNAEGLRENKLGIKLLFVPILDYISDEEMAAVKAFESFGGKVVFTNCAHRTFTRHGAYEIKERKRTQFDGYLDCSDVLYFYGISPLISFDKYEETLLLQTLDIPNGHLAVITNTDNVGRPNRTPTLLVPDGIKSVTIDSFESPKPKKLKVKKGKVTLPEITNGAFVVMKR